MNAALVDRPDHVREIRCALTDPHAVCEGLGLFAGKRSFRRQAAGVLVRCPWHDDRTPSCSIRRGPDGTLAVRCHGCGATGDVFSLVAVMHRLNTHRDFPRVLRLAAELAGLHAIAHELSTGKIGIERPKVAPAVSHSPRDYPPIAEVNALWEACVPLTDDPETVAWLAGRGLDPELLASEDVARALPVAVTLPRWASCRGEPWTMSGHRLIVPMRDAGAVIRSVRAGRTSDGDTAKRLPPGGYRATGLVLACSFAIAMLAGMYAPPCMLVVEGEPDFLAATMWPLREPTARVGLVSGSWSPALAARVPIGTTVYLWTDRDSAGNRYASEVARELQRGRGCRLFRWAEQDVR